MAIQPGNAGSRAGDLPLADAMVGMTHVVRRAFIDASREHGLTPVQSELLCVLISGRTRMSELGHILDIEKSSLSGLVDRAERRGLVKRAQHPEDRRCYQVELTPGGARIALACHEDVTRRLEAMAHELPAPDRRCLASGMAQLLATHEAERLRPNDVRHHR